jgi:hypothetical protein
LETFSRPVRVSCNRLDQRESAVATLGNSAHINGVVLGEIVDHTFTQTGGTPPITWDNFTFVDYTPFFSSSNGSAPFLPATFDDNTQLFEWDTVGSPRGTYVWSVRASNDVGSSTGILTIQTYIPEPASVSLATIAFVVLAGMVRRRPTACLSRPTLAFTSCVAEALRRRERPRWSTR